MPLHIDNTTVTACLNKHRSNNKVKHTNQIVMEVYSIAFEWDIVFEIHWIASKDNVLADALSRGDMHAQVLPKPTGLC